MTEHPEDTVESLDNRHRKLMNELVALETELRFLMPYQLLNVVKVARSRVSALRKEIGEIYKTMRGGIPPVKLL